MSTPSLPRANCTGDIDSCVGEVITFARLVNAEYTFNLTVTDDSGATHYTSRSITVTGIVTRVTTYVGSIDHGTFIAIIICIVIFVILCPTFTFIYCRCMQKRERHKKKEVLQKELGAAFETFERLALEAEGGKGSAAAVKRYDGNGDGRIDLVEFRVLIHLLSDDKISDEEINETFTYLDQDKSGFLETNELEEMLEILHVTMPETRKNRIEPSGPNEVANPVHAKIKGGGGAAVVPQDAKEDKEDEDGGGQNKETALRVAKAESGVLAPDHDL